MNRAIDAVTHSNADPIIWEDIVESFKHRLDSKINVIIDLEDWKFIKVLGDQIHLIHYHCEDHCGPEVPSIKITTFTAWHLKRCTYCDETVPDDVHSILHTMLPNGR